MNAERFSLPLTDPLATAAGEITEREGFIVTVDEPTAGVGEATPLPGWTESLAACRDALTTADPEAVDELPPAARHGLSLAMLDAAARDAERPLYQYLGRDERVGTVPVNATVGDADIGATADRVEAAAESGFPAVKLKVGLRSLDADVARVEAARSAAPDVEIRLDANGAWDHDTAANAVDAVEPLDVAYVEQPLPATDLTGHATLRGRGVGIALDEGLYEHGVDAVLDADAADAWILKPMAMGGPDVALDAAVLARGAGIDPVVTTTVDGGVARAAAVHVAAAVPDVSPCGLATRDLLAADLVPDHAPVRDGRARIPQKDGNIPLPSSVNRA
jgi:o-succinylbenzoate synthase